MKKNSAVLNTLYKFRQVLILLALCIFFAFMLPGTFLVPNNFRSILYSISLIGLMICGATFPVLVGGIDRTVSAVAAISGAVCCTIIVNSNYTDTGVIIGMIAGIGIGVISGLVHGLIVAHLDIPAFLLTLATSQVIYGFVQTITGNKLIVVMEPELFTKIGSARILEIPIPIYIMIACFTAAYFILNKFTYGRRIYSVGGNREASKLSGIPVKWIIIIAYMMSGLMAGIAGIVLASMNQQASSYAAQGYENDVLAAIVVGGISLRGGSGTLQGAIFGALLIGILTNGLRLMGIDTIYHNLVKGIIIIVAVAIDMYSSYKMSGLKHDGLLKRLIKSKRLQSN